MNRHAVYIVECARYERTFEWTEDEPTKEGWYWAKGISQNEPQIVKVEEFLDRLYAWGVALDDQWELTYFNLWLGPLPVPPFPVKEVTG